MDKYPPEFASAVSALARAAGLWAAFQAAGDDQAEEKMTEVDQLYEKLMEMNAYDDDPIQIKDMACGAGLVTASQSMLDGEGLDDHQQCFQDASMPTPENVSEELWTRTQKLCWASSRWACSQVQGDDEAAQRAKREFDRHVRSIAGFGVGKGPQDTETYRARAQEVMPATVVMFSGCQDCQTSADVSNTASFDLPQDAGPGGAGGALTNSMIKAVSDSGDYTWVSLLKAMREILDGNYTQIPMLSCSCKMDLNSSFSIQNPEPSGQYRALLIGINYVGSSAELRGCHNDIETMTRYITDQGYADGEMKILLDDGEHEEPTLQGIVDAMTWLSSGAQAGDSLFFHYSGHGASVRDDDGDEADGKDEALVPVDYKEAGLLRDDKVFEILVGPLTEGVQLTCILDCCHSGTILDLPYMFKADDGSLAAVEDGSFTEMQENPAFDFGKIIQVIQDHPGLAAGVAVVGAIGLAAFTAYSANNESQGGIGGMVDTAMNMAGGGGGDMMGTAMNLAGRFFG